MQSWLEFELNGEVCRVEGESILRTFSEYLYARRYIRAESPDAWNGGPLLLMIDRNHEGEAVVRTVDSSAVLLAQMAGRRMYTANGLLRAERAHPAAEEMFKAGGLECSELGWRNLMLLLVEGYHRADLKTYGQLDTQFDGWTSRTVDYRALKSVAVRVFGKAQRRRKERELARGKEGSDPPKPDVAEDFGFRLGERIEAPEEFSYIDSKKRRFFRPHTVFELQQLLAQYPDSLLVAGGTSVARNGEREVSNLFSTEAIAELRSIIDHGDKWEIGSAAPLTMLDEVAGPEDPALRRAIGGFASRPLRNRATLGGHLISAPSPSDLIPVLVASDAMVRLISPDGERDVPAGRFVTGPGQTTLRKGEIVKSVVLPRFGPDELKRRGVESRVADVYRVAHRASMSVPLVSAAFAVELAEEHVIKKACLAYSGLGPVVIRAKKTEDALTGKPWTEETAMKVLRTLDSELTPDREVAGGSEEYLRQLVGLLFQKFFYEYRNPGRGKQPLGAADEWLQTDQPFFDVL